MLGVLRFLIGGTASVAEEVNDCKAERYQLEKQCHDRAMEGIRTVSRSIQIRTVAQPLNVDSISSEEKKTPKER